MFWKKQEARFAEECVCGRLRELMRCAHVYIFHLCSLGVLKREMLPRFTFQVPSRPSPCAAAIYRHEKGGAQATSIFLPQRCSYCCRIATMRSRTATPPYCHCPHRSGIIPGHIPRTAARSKAGPTTSSSSTAQPANDFVFNSICDTVTSNTISVAWMLLTTRESPATHAPPHAQRDRRSQPSLGE